MKHLRKETDNAPQTSTRRKSRCHRRARSEDRGRGQSRHTGPRARGEDRGRGRGRHTWASPADLAPTASLDERALKARVGEILNRWPVAGLAIGVIRGGSLAWFHGHGVADVGSGTPVGPDTVFRIASVTKTITAVAVMQLQERGLVDLDAPASHYLRAFRLIPARPGFPACHAAAPADSHRRGLGSRGLKAVTDREVVQAGAGAVYSTTSDMAATPQPCWAAVQASTAGCCSPTRSPPCSSRTTSPIPAYPAWAWGASAAKSASTRP